MKKDRSIALILNSLTLGGAENQTFLLAKEIKNHSDYTPVIISLTSGGKLESLLQEENIKYIIIGASNRDLRRFLLKKTAIVLQLSRILRRHHVEMVIPRTYYPNLIGNLAAAAAGIKKHYWNQVGREWDTPITISEKLCIRLTKHFIANSNEAAEYLALRTRINLEKIQVLRNVYYERGEAKGDLSRKDFGLKETDFVVLLAGNFFPSKDHITVLRAAAMLQSEFPDIKFLFAGYSPSEQFLHSLKALAFDLKIMNVVFADVTANMQDVLQMSDMGLFTSVKKHTEGSPNVILDYMYASLPVLASDIPCNRELLGNNGSVFYVPEDDKDLSDKIKNFYKDPDFRKKESEANGIRVRENHNPSMLSQHLKFFISDEK